MLSCGFRAEDDTSTVLLGTNGRIHLTNPLHPEPGNTITVVRDRAIRGLEAPRQLALDEALGNAKAIAAVLRTGREDGYWAI